VGDTPKSAFRSDRERDSYSPPTSPTDLTNLVLNDIGTVHSSNESPQQAQKNDPHHELSNWLASVIAALPAKEEMAGALTPQYYRAQQEYLQLFDRKDLMKVLLSAVREVVEIQQYFELNHGSLGSAAIAGPDGGLVMGMPLCIMPWGCIHYNMLGKMSPMLLRSGILQALKAIKHFIEL